MYESEDSKNRFANNLQIIDMIINNIVYLMEIAQLHEREILSL